ncbi:hypothetical protein B0H13DRAFT_1887836 [Mycena leptocephala]|nr:hypothetical protein B0H13DRAFT_1887836 [Mycena leptocephala]
MPRQNTGADTRLSNITGYLTPALTLLDELNDAFGSSFVQPITKQLYLRLLDPFIRQSSIILAISQTQQERSKIKYFFRKGEMNTLLKDCHSGLAKALEVFKAEIGTMTFNSMDEMKQKTKDMHNELLELISMLSDDTSDTSSLVYQGSNRSKNSSRSFSMLPSKPKIFHGRESELEHIIQNLNQDSPRIAILGGGGMGKTSLARAALHHPNISTKFEHIFFVSAESASNRTELAALVGLHMGMDPGKDLTKPVVQYFFKEPLSDDAARQTFIDITDGSPNNEGMKRLLEFTDNMPLAVDLMAHLADYEGCPKVLARWDAEKTSLLAAGNDRQSNLDASIRLSLSSPRITSSAKELLSLLSILPDGLSDVELLQSNLPIRNIQSCKATLLSTSLAYTDNKKRLRLAVHFIGEALLSERHTISDPELLIAQGISIASISMIPDLRVGGLYLAAGVYHFDSKGHMSTARGLWEKALNLILLFLADLMWAMGDASTAEVHWNEARKLANLAVDPCQEARSLRGLARCTRQRGDYRKSISQLNRAKEILGILETVLKNLNEAKTTFSIMKDFYGVTSCEIILAELKLREGDTLSANTLFLQCLKSIWERDNDWCHVVEYTFTWPVAYLVHVRQSKGKLALHKALIFIGDVFIVQGDAETAYSLFTVALGGFVYMDVHYSQAQCLLRLGVLASKRGNFSHATNLWTAARPLFERSLQAKDVAQIDARLAELGDNQKVLMHLAALHPPETAGEELSVEVKKARIKDEVAASQNLPEGIILSSM